MHSKRSLLEELKITAEATKEAIQIVTIELLFATTFLTPAALLFNNINEALEPDINTDDIVAINTEKALELLGSHNDFFHKVRDFVGLKCKKPEQIRNRLYSMGITEKEGARTRFSFHTNFWKAVTSSPEHKQAEENWKSMTLDDKKSYLQDIANKYYKYNPTLLKNGLKSELCWFHEGSDLESDGSGFHTNAYYSPYFKQISINTYEIDYLGQVSGSLAHELTHADDDLNQANDVYTELKKADNVHNYNPGGDLGRTQPGEVLPELVGRAVRTRDFGDPKELEGKNIFCSNTNMRVFSLLKINPDLKNGLGEDGILTISELEERLGRKIEDLCPSPNDLQSKSFFRDDPHSETSLAQQNLTNRDFSKSTFLDIQMDDKNFAGSNFSNTVFKEGFHKNVSFRGCRFTGASCDDITFYLCDFTGVDLSQMKNIPSDPTFVGCKISITQANIKVLDQHPKSFIGTTFVEENGQELVEDFIEKTSAIQKEKPSHAKETAKKLVEKLAEEERKNRGPKKGGRIAKPRIKSKGLGQ